MLLHVGSYCFWLESALSSYPERIESSAIDNALNGPLRHIQVIGYLLWGPKAFGRLFLAVKSLSEFFDLVLEVSGSLFKFLNAVLGTDRTA